MSHIKPYVWLLALVSVPAFGNILFSSGTFTEDDDVALIQFSISANNLVTVESFGYAGGTAGNGTMVPEGGFAPNAILFDSSGNEIVSDNGGHCAVTGHDSVTNNCDDPYFQENLSAGTYTLAIVEWDNTTTDGYLPDGFTQDGKPGFTCAEGGLTGNFCDVTTATYVQRDGDYAVQISAANLTPEPSTFLLTTLAGALLIASRLRRRSIS